MIDIKNLNKLFEINKTQTFQALKDINITIKDGELCMIKGISGSGKSTLLSIIATLLKPTSGSVEIDGENIISYSDYHASIYRNKKIGYITQSFHLFTNLSVEENISTPLINSKLTDKEMKEKLDQAMQIANIQHKSKQIVSTLSGGEKQRVIIARALVNDPDIILCDEPTANLDKDNALIFIDILKKLHNMKKTIILSTHDPIFDDIEFIDKTHHIKDGKIE